MQDRTTALCVTYSMSPLTLVGAGLRASNVLSTLYGAHDIGNGIFGNLNCIDGNTLCIACHEMTAVAGFLGNRRYPSLLIVRAALIGINVELHNADSGFCGGLYLQL